ncbi:MAG: cellulase family glycosylhydrolase [Acidobacteriota bacterium]
MNLRVCFAFAILSLSFLHAQAVKSIKGGPYPVIFNEDFSDSLLTSTRWSPRQNYTYASSISGSCITMELASAQSKMISFSVPVDGIKGGAIAISSDIKAENISQPPNSWNGIKVMLKITLSDGTALYPQLIAPTGTFDWMNKSTYISLPASAVSATLYLGLEKCSGKVWFDNILFRLIKDPRDIPPARDPNINIDKYHSQVPSLRGTMVSTSMKQSDIEVLAGEWKANLMRWQIGGTSYPLGIQTPGLDSVLEKELRLLDSAIEWAKPYRIKIVADLHGLSKGCLKSAEAESKLVEVWKKISLRYKDTDQIWAYDIANEPDTREGDWNTPGYLAWEDLAEKVAREIRNIDSVKPVIIESALGDPAGFLTLRPIDFSIPRVIYSAHFYLPHAFTHQTLYDYKTSYSYPDTIEGKYWDKNTLAEKLSPVVEFQNRYRVPVYIGEFSAIRWAPSNSAYRYLKDCIELFETYGWDWTYHAFREFDGWSVEHSEDQNDHAPTPLPNSRQLLLRSYFENNVTHAENKAQQAGTFYLSQNYPNPFNPQTVISYSVPERSFVELKVYDMLGREAAVLVNKDLGTGGYTVQFNASGLPSGVYIYTLQAGRLRHSRKLLLLK